MENEKYVLFYETNKKSNVLRILGEEFVRNNKNKGKIIYENKIYSLRELFPINDNINNELKIIMILSKNCYNKSCMFKNCSSLIEIQFNNNIYNKEDIFFNSQNNLYIGLDKDKEINNNYNNEFNYERNSFIYNSSPNEFEKVSNRREKLMYDDLKWNTKISVMKEIFSNCSSLIYIPDISEWDTSNIIDMNKVFYNCSSLPLLPDISEWNTSNVIDMNKMFYNCSSLLSIPDTSKWDIKNVSNMNEIYINCISLTSLPDIFLNKIINILNFIIISFNYLGDIPKKNNMNMNSMFEKSCSVIKLIYEIKDDKVINIFNRYFVENNKGKCKLIINNKLYSLTENYKIIDNNMKYLKIKLIILNNVKINLSCMFKDCKSFKKISFVSKDEINLENEFQSQETDNINENIYTSDPHELENQSILSNNIFEEIEDNINKNKSSIYNKFSFVYS